MRGLCSRPNSHADRRTYLFVGSYADAHTFPNSYGHTYPNLHPYLYAPIHSNPYQYPYPHTNHPTNCSASLRPCPPARA